MDVQSCSICSLVQLTSADRERRDRSRPPAPARSSRRPPTSSGRGRSDPDRRAAAGASAPARPGRPSAERDRDATRRHLHLPGLRRASWPSPGSTAASCGTTLEGDFSVGRFGRLNRDQLTLLESFLRSRGNLREMERELGISYPTVRSRVEALVRALGFGPRADADDVDEPAGERGRRRPRTREEILQALARHEMSAEDAAAAIRALGRTAS